MLLLCRRLYAQLMLVRARCGQAAAGSGGDALLAPRGAQGARVVARM